MLELTGATRRARDARLAGVPPGDESDLPPDVFAATVGLLEELTAISSPSGDAAGLGRMAARLAAELTARGLAAEVRQGLEPPGAAAGDAPALPGLAALAGALDLLARRGVAPPADLLVVAVPDEEVGGELSRAAVERWGAGARAVWVLEPGERGSEEGAETLVGGRRGLFDWRLEVRGTAAHSGLHLADGRSALLAAARWCLEAATAGAACGEGSGPTINVGRLLAGDASFVDDLGAHHDWVGTGRQLNVVPDRAIAEGEARFSRAGDDEEVARRLTGIAARVGAATGASLRFDRTATIPPVDPGNARQRAGCARAVALAAARGWRLEVEEERGGISFPNFLPIPGRVPVLDGLGPVGGGMHTRDEYVELASLRRRIVLLADLLQGGGTPPAEAPAPRG